MQSSYIIFVFVAIASSSIANSQSAGRNSSPAELEAARSSHLAEVARITNERLAALAAARARATTPVPAILPAPPAPPVLAVSPLLAPDVAAATAAHLSEVRRQTEAFLAALAAARARATTPVPAILPAPPAPPVLAAFFSPDVAAATAAHLSEVRRQTEAFLAARALVLARPPRPVENFERRPYSTSYAVSDPITGDHKSASEAREGEITRGSYSLVQPDGVLRTVNYVVTPTDGFRAQVLNDGVQVFGSAPPAVDPPVEPNVELVILSQAQAPQDPAVLSATEEQEVARITEE